MTSIDVQSYTEVDSDMDVDTQLEKYETDIKNIKVIVNSTYTTDFNNYLTDGIVYAPDTTNNVSITITSNILQYLGPIFQELYQKCENNVIILSAPLNVNYEDNVITLLKFIEIVVSEFSEDEQTQIIELSNTYSSKHVKNELYLKFKSLCFNFGKNHKMFPNLYNELNTEHLRKIHDFSWLCDYLQIYTGVIASMYWMRSFMCMSNVIHISDVIEISPKTHMENVYRAKRTLYFLKHPGDILEPSKDILDKLDLDINKDIYIEHQILNITHKFETAQSERFKQFYIEFKDIIGVNQPTEDELLTYAIESKHLISDDIEKIKFDHKVQRLLQFHSAVKEVEFKVNRPLRDEEMNDVKRSMYEKGCLTEADVKDSVFMHYYKFVITNYVTNS